MSMPLLELEGTWEEVRAYDAQLIGKRVHLRIVSTEKKSSDASSVQPNQALLAAMQRVEEVQQGMNPKQGTDSVAILREGRSGAMYGDDSCD